MDNIICIHLHKNVFRNVIYTMLQKEFDVMIYGPRIGIFNRLFGFWFLLNVAYLKTFRKATRHLIQLCCNFLEVSISRLIVPRKTQFKFSILQRLNREVLGRTIKNSKITISCKFFHKKQFFKLVNTNLKIK